MPQVDFVSICAGGFDVMAGIVTHDREELTDVPVNHLRTIPGVEDAELPLHLKVLKDNEEWSPGERPERSWRSCSRPPPHARFAPPQAGARPARAPVRVGPRHRGRMRG
jgi:hypothetical protein